MAKPKTPPKGANTGPVRSKRRLPLPKGNPTRGGKIFGNTHNCSMPRSSKGK